MKIVFRLIALVVLGLSADSSLAQHWRQYQHDGGHRGQSNVNINPAALAQVWSAAGFIEPRILGDTLYARKRESLSTRVAAFSLADGQEKWSTLGDGVYFGNLAVAKDFLILEGFNYNGGFSDVFVVLDAATGQERYRIDLPLEFSFSEPNLAKEAGGPVAYCTDGGTLAAVRVGKDAANILWTQTGDIGLSEATIVGDSVITFGAGGTGSAFVRATGTKSVFFNGGPSLGSAPASANPRRGDFYVKLDYKTEGVTRVRAFHYNSNDSIELLWTRVTPFNQSGGMVAIGSDGNLYAVGSGEIAIIDPNDGSTIKSIPFPFVNGCTPALSGNVLWVYSDTDTYAYDASSLDLLAAFPGSSGFNFGFDSVGAFVPGTAALNFKDRIQVYRENP
ncbi:MAG: PQQ-binding-like beta-propeller repeat protein [Spartobacteria bacterium]